MVLTIVNLPSPELVQVQHTRIVVILEERFPQAAELLVEVGTDILVLTAFPLAH